MVVKKHSLVLMVRWAHPECMNLTTSYSRYSDLPADRDLDRVSADLRALPTPVMDGTGRAGRSTWLRRHLHLRTRHA